MVVKTCLSLSDCLFVVPANVKHVTRLGVFCIPARSPDVDIYQTLYENELLENAMNLNS